MGIKLRICACLLGHLDSLHYFSLRDQGGFDLDFFRNFRGYGYLFRD